MSAADKSPVDLIRAKYHYYHWDNFNYQAAIAHCRRQTGGFLLDKTLFVHDSVYNFLKYKNIEQMRWFLRPPAYFRNFILDQPYKITRPAVYYIGAGFGKILDKTAIQTWESASPYNITYIFSHPDRAKLYAQQHWLRLQAYGTAIDRTSLIHTLFNLKAIWFQQIENNFVIHKSIWDNQLTSDHSCLYPHRIAMDKSSQLALGYYDVLTDRMAELIGWFGIGFIAFNLPKSVRMRTREATERWASRTMVNYLPLMPRAPLKFFAIKPVVKVLYNPRVLALLLGYKFLMNFGQNIAASIELEQNAPELAALLRQQNRSITSAGYYSDLLRAVQKRSATTNAMK